MWIIVFNPAALLWLLLLLLVVDVVVVVVVVCCCFLFVVVDFVCCCCCCLLLLISLFVFPQSVTTASAYEKEGTKSTSEILREKHYVHVLKIVGGCT